MSSHRRDQFRFRPHSRSRSPAASNGRRSRPPTETMPRHDKDHHRTAPGSSSGGCNSHRPPPNNSKVSRGGGRRPDHVNHHRHPDQDQRQHRTDSDRSAAQFGAGGGEKVVPAVDKEKVNMALSGKLTEDTNTYKGVVIKYNEPEDACKPRRLWRLYPFKGEEALPVLYIHRQSGYLVGRERKIADIPLDHPSISKQHAVIQFRRVDASGRQVVRPYVMDLASANGTFVNNKPVDAQRFHELRERDMLKFGFSSREYILLHDRSEGMQPPAPDA